MELRYSRYKLPLLPEPKSRKRAANASDDHSSSSSRLTTPPRQKGATPEHPSPRSIRSEKRQARLASDLPYVSAAKRRRQERWAEEVRTRRENMAVTVAFQDSALAHFEYVSVSTTLHRRLLAAVLQADPVLVLQLMQDPRMPDDAITTQYSYADERTPLVEAFASGNAQLLVALLKGRALRKRSGVPPAPLEPALHQNVLFVPSVPSDDFVALRKYNAPRALREPLLLQLARRNTPYSVIERFRPLSLYLDSPAFDPATADAESIDSLIKKAHANVGTIQGEFYCSTDYGRAAVEALRWGHGILALNLGRPAFPLLAQQILAFNNDGPFDSDAVRFTRSSTSPYFIPVHAAAAIGSVAVLEWLSAQFERSMFLMDSENWTPLHYAAASENPDALKWLISKGAKVSFTNRAGETALHIAVERGREENVKILVATLEALDRIALRSTCSVPLDPSTLPPDARSCANWKTARGLTALHLAAQRGNEGIVRALLRHPYLHVDATTKDGVTPIMMAAAHGRSACVSELLPVSSWTADALNRDLLTHAAINGQSNVVGLLLKWSVHQHDYVDVCENTALHYACAYGWLPVLQMLVRIDPTLLTRKNRKNLTPTAVAYRNGHFGLLWWLIGNGHDESCLDVEAIVTNWMNTHDCN